MIEQILIDYLNSALSVPVYAEMPSGAKGSFVIIEKTGGGKENHILSATVSLQSYGETLAAASHLNEQVKSAMDEITYERPDICKTKLNTDYNFTDTATKHYRYQAVFDVFYY